MFIYVHMKSERLGFQREIQLCNLRVSISNSCPFEVLSGCDLVNFRISSEMQYANIHFLVLVGCAVVWLLMWLAGSSNAHQGQRRILYIRTEVSKVSTLHN